MDNPIQTPDTSTHPEPQHGLRWIFIGPDGLRAGWSILVFLAVVFLLSVLTGFLFRNFIPRGHAPLAPGTSIVIEIIQFSVVLLATFVMALIEGRSLLAYGYAGLSRLPRFLWGALWGFVAISILAGVLWKAHFIAFDGKMLSGATAWRYAILWGVSFLFTGLFEESLLRGYLQFTLTRGLGFWWGALLLSVLFGLIHKTNTGESPVGLFSAAAIGFVFCISLWYTGSLWWAIGFHAAWDWGETFFYGTPDSGMIAQGHLLSEHPTGALLWSGGPTGPEGSLLVLPLIAVTALFAWLWWRKRAVSPFTASKATSFSD